MGWWEGGGRVEEGKEEEEKEGKEEGKEEEKEKKYWESEKQREGE